MTRNLLLGVGLLAATATLQSCFDKNYDLDDIDMTIGIGTGESEVLWLPSGSTSDIILGDFITLGDEDYVKIYEDEAGREFYCIDSEGKDNMALLAATNGTLRMQILNRTTSSMDLTKRPSSWEQGSIMLDLVNPLLFAEIRNDVPVALDCQLCYVCYLDGNETEHHLESFTIDPRATSRFCFADQTPTVRFPERFRDAQYKRTTGLRDNLRETPDSVVVLLKQADMTAYAAQGTTGPFSIKCNVYTPLSVGKNFTFTNTSIEDGWYEDIKLDDDADFEVQGLMLKANVVSSISLDITVTATAIDSLGNAIPDIMVSSAHANCESTSPIELELKSRKGTLTQYINGAEGVPQLDGIIIETKAHGTDRSERSVICPNDHIKLTNLRLGLKGGIIFDAN